MSDHLFFSYSQRDLADVEHLAGRLEELGLQVWWFYDKQVAGQDYTSQLMAAIEAARAVVVVLSSNSVNSPSVLDEVLYAKNKRKRIITLLMDECDGPLRFQLASTHMIDAQSGRDPLPRLLEALNQPQPLAAPTAFLDALEDCQHLVRPNHAPLEIPSHASGAIEITLCTIGRYPGKTMVVDRDIVRVSRHHASIRARVGVDGSWCFLLYDDDSAHGTFVNGRRIAGAYELQNNDLIELAEDEMKLRFSVLPPTN